MTLKVSYFDIRGLAEVPRMMLSDAGVKFEDHRFSYADWPKFKPQMTFGQVPCLFDGDEQIVQFGAIVRHLARKHNLDGNSESEKTFVDMFFEGLRDVHNKYTNMIYNNYEAGKAPYIADTLPGLLAVLEKLVKTYKNGEKYIIGDKVTYADFGLFEELDIHLVLSPGCLDNYPTLKAFHQRFAARPSLQAFLKHRAAVNYPINGNGKQ